MSVVVVTPPQPVLALEDVKAHLRVEHDDDDALIEIFMAAATAHIDGPDGWLGRALGVQTLKLLAPDFGVFCDGRIPLPYPPLISVTAVRYVDADGVQQTVSGDRYILLSGPSLLPVYGQAWPVGRSFPESVEIEYEVGYGELPAPIQAALLLMVGDLYANRETAVVGTIAAEVPMSVTVERLLSPYRMWGVAPAYD